MADDEDDDYVSDNNTESSLSDISMHSEDDGWIRQ